MNAAERQERQLMRTARAVFELWLDGPEGSAWLKADDRSTKAVVTFEGGNCRGVVIESRATAT